MRPHERLVLAAHDRAGARRLDDSWLEERWADQTTRVLVVAGTRVRPRSNGAVAWVSPQDAPDGLRLLLGEHQGRAWFAVIVDADRADAEWVPLRALLTSLGDDAALVLHALGMAEWLAVTRFCPRCGGPLTPHASGHELKCSNGHTQFPRTDPAVIMLITDSSSGVERCLLGRQAVWPQGRFSTLAGFCEPGESLEDAVRREVAEETGVRVGEVTYFGNQPWPLPASLMLGFFGTATDPGIVVDRTEIEEARWFTREELAAGAESGAIALPGPVSISRALIEEWYGAPLPGSW